MLETDSAFIARRFRRQRMLRRSNQSGTRNREVCSEIVWYHAGDVANLDEIEGVDFWHTNPDLEWLPL